MQTLFSKLTYNTPNRLEQSRVLHHLSRFELEQNSNHLQKEAIMYMRLSRVLNSVIDKTIWLIY